MGDALVSVDLATMRGGVRVDLRDEDAASERWSDATLERHIARALRELSLAAPREASVTLQTTESSRDLDISSASDRVSIDAVEYPTGRYPASYVPFSMWGDTLTLLIEGAPNAGEDVLVRYAALHTLDAQGTTLPERLEDVLATGAAAYAALEWSSYATNRINAGGDAVWRDYHAWGQERMAAFARALAKHGRERRLRSRSLSAR